MKISMDNLSYIKSWILPSYFVNLYNMDNLSICRNILRTLLDNMGWTNALVVREHVYSNLVCVFT